MRDNNYSAADRQFMLDALRKHGCIRIYRRTSGAAMIANDLAVEDLVTLELVQEDEQSSYLLVKEKA